MTDNQLLILLGFREAGMSLGMISMMFGLREAKVKKVLRDIDRDYAISCGGNDVHIK